MPSDVLIAAAKYVRDLMSIDEQLIRIGRQNFTRKDFDLGYVVVDALGPALRKGHIEKYDGEAEQMTYAAVWSGPVTMDFYEPEAYTRSSEFSLRTRSEAARELQQSLGIAVYQPSEITDVKALTGQQYGEQVQVKMIVEKTREIVIDTLRIDDAQLEIRTEGGIQHVS